MTRKPYQPVPLIFAACAAVLVSACSAPAALRPPDIVEIPASHTQDVPSSRPAATTAPRPDAVVRRQPAATAAPAASQPNPVVRSQAAPTAASADTAKQASTYQSVPQPIPNQPTLPGASVGQPPVPPAGEIAPVPGPRQIDPLNNRLPAEPTSVVPPVVQPADAGFKDYGVNPFVNTNRDQLSTFGLDVDNASYNVAKRYIQQGSLPPFQSVRVEEFVNSFKQGFPSPRTSVFGIFADGAPSPFHTDGSYLLRIGVQGYELPVFARKPANFTFVIDESGSMSDGNRIAVARQAVRSLVAKLNAADTVGVVAFTDRTRVVIEPTSATNRDAIERAIGTIYPKNGTNLQSGLVAGYDMAVANLRPGNTNRIILISDGVANEGGIRPEEILRSVQDYANRGVAFTSVGVGFGNYNDTLMEQLADKSEGGNYMYLNTLEDADNLFANKLVALQEIAKDAKVQVEFNPAVVGEYRLLGYENRAINDADFRNDAVVGGGIGAGHTSTAIYALRLLPNSSGRIGTVNLRWTDPTSHAVSEINGDVLTSDLRSRFEDTTPRFQLAATVAQFAEVLRKSAYRGEGNLRDLSHRAHAIAQLIPDDPAVGEFSALVSRAAQQR